MYIKNPADNADVDFDTIIESLTKHNDAVVTEPAPNDTPSDTTQTSSQTGTETIEVSETKRFSERLNKKIAEERENIAKSFGYDNWNTFNTAMKDKKITENGYDPDTINKLFNDLKQQDPDYQEALRFKKEKEELEKQLWAKDELNKLNNKFGTSFKSVDELSEDVVKAWNSGLELQRAYAAFNFDAIAENAKKSVLATGNGGKEHMKAAPSGSVTVTPSKQIDSATLYWMKQINPNMSDDDIKKYFDRR